MQSADVSAVEFATWVVVLAGAAMALWRGSRAIFQSTLGSRRDLRGKLDRMACGTTQDYVKQLFGPPVLRSGLLDAEYEEVTYVTRHGFVVVLEERADGKTAAWSFTATDRRFAWDLYYVTLGQIEVTLGRDTFAEADRTGREDAVVDGVNTDALYRVLYGAHTGQYAESHYRGNPGGYQTFVLLWNDAGAGRRPDLEAIQEAWMPKLPEVETGFMPADQIEAQYLRALGPIRPASAPNTLTVLGASMEVDVWPNMAIHHHIVRVLPIASTHRQLQAYRWSGASGLRARLIRMWLRWRG